MRNIRNHTSIMWCWELNQGFGNSVRESMSQVNNLQISDPQWDVPYIDPPICPNDCFYDGMSCRCDYRSPYSSADASRSIQISSLSFNQVATFEYWVYLMGPASNTWIIFAHQSYGNCLRVTSTASTFYLFLEGSTYSNAYSYPALYNWYHVAIMTTLKPTVNPTTVYISSGLAITQNFVASNCAMAFSDGVLTLSSLLGYFRDVRISKYIKTLSISSDNNRNNPCHRVTNNYCSSSMFSLYLPMNDTSGVPTLTNLVGGANDITTLFPNPHNLAYVWKPIENDPLIICGFNLMYYSPTGLCKNQVGYQAYISPLSFTLPGLRSAYPEQTYCTWIYMKTDSFARIMTANLGI